MDVFWNSNCVDTDLAGWWLLKTLYIQDNHPVEVDLPSQGFDRYEKDMKKKRRIVLIVLVASVLLWMTSSLHNITVAAVAAVPLVFLTMTRILVSDDIRKLPWDTLLLVAGGLSLGLALQDTGLLEHFANRMFGSLHSTLL